MPSKNGTCKFWYKFYMYLLYEFLRRPPCTSCTIYLIFSGNRVTIFLLGPILFLGITNFVHTHPIFVSQKVISSQVFANFNLGYQFGPLPTFYIFLFRVVRVHPTSWDQLRPLQKFCNFLISLVQVHATSWDQLRQFLFSLVRVHPTSWDQLGPLQTLYNFFVSGGPSSSHLLGPARTPPNFLQIFNFASPSSCHLLGPAWTNFCFRWSKFIPPPGTSSDPSKIFTNFCFWWSELIPPPGTSSDPSQFFASFCFR